MTIDIDVGKIDIALAVGVKGPVFISVIWKLSPTGAPIEGYLAGGTHSLNTLNIKRS